MRRNILALILFILLVILLVGVVYSPFAGRFSLTDHPTVGSVVKELSQKQSPAIPVNEVERLNLEQVLWEEINAEGLSDNVSLYYKNLLDGYEIMINADRSWVPASMVKAFVVVEAFRQKREKIINFDTRVIIKKENIVSNELESSSYQPLREGVKATVRELVYAMIVQSDNTAYNTLLDLLDRRNITSTLRKLGLINTVLGEKLNLSDEQYALDAAVPGQQPNRTTARDFGQLFNILYQNKIEDAQEILTILKQQKINDMIPALLPKDVEVAHKTGRLSPYFHDGGIVFKPNEPFILVIFTNHDESAILARLAKISYYKTRDVLGESTSLFFREMGQWVKSLLGID